MVRIKMDDRTSLVLTSNFVLCKDLNKNRCVLLFCGEPKDELKAFLQLERFIKRNTKRKIKTTKIIKGNEGLQ